MVWKQFPLTNPERGKFANDAFQLQTTKKAGDAHDPLKSGRSMWAKGGGSSRLSLRQSAIKSEPEKRRKPKEANKGKPHVGQALFLWEQGWKKDRICEFLGITPGQLRYATSFCRVAVEPEGWQDTDKKHLQSKSDL